MAQSPAHQFGQIIGHMLEEAVRPPLQAVATKYGLYLDWKHPRAARGGKSKVSWTDHWGNVHDLDYVLEAGGSEDAIGRPKAFIEIAYRRYTKHSRNKAQEIQGAISPLAETYSDDHPFLGVVLAGVFTEASLAQLRSNAFGVLHFEFAEIATAFKTQGIDAYFDEGSRDAEVRAKVSAYRKLSAQRKAAIPTALLEQNKKAFNEFIHQLEVSLNRQVSSVYVLSLHGISRETQSIEEAITVINQHDENEAIRGFVRYEIIVRYSNGDEVRGTFESKPEATRFLNLLK